MRNTAPHDDDDYRKQFSGGWSPATASEEHLPATGRRITHFENMQGGTTTDVIVRRIGDSEVTIGSTGTLREKMMSLGEKAHLEISTLAEALNRTLTRVDYMGHYTAYLLDQLSEKEFMKLSEKFSYEPKPQNIPDLSKKIEIVLSHTSAELTTGDLAELFMTTENSVSGSIEYLRDLGYFPT